MHEIFHKILSIETNFKDIFDPKTDFLGISTQDFHVLKFNERSSS